MSSLQIDEHRRKEAMQEIGNMFAGILALIGKRHARVLNILAESKFGNKNYIKIAGKIAIYSSELVKAVKRCKQICSLILNNHRDFNPTEHYGKIYFDPDAPSETFSITTLFEEACPQELLWVRHKWNIEMLRLEQLHGAMAAINVWCDAVYDLTGEHIIKEMTDFTGERPRSYQMTPEFQKRVYEEADKIDNTGKEKDNGD